jgi:polyhydroxyalkanoate synthesis regulator phasin
MANVTLKKEERKTPYVQGGYLTSQDNLAEEDIFNSFQSLEVEETHLTQQKEQLTSLLNQLETKAKEEVEKRKRKIDRLNSEVTDLKRRCEKIASWINTGSTVECNQTGL